MNKETYINIINEMQATVSKVDGNIFMIQPITESKLTGLFGSNTVLPKSYPVWIPTKESNSVIKYSENVQLNNSFRGVFEREVKKGEEIHPEEIAYLIKVTEGKPQFHEEVEGLPEIIQRISTLVEPTLSGWITKKAITIAKGKLLAKDAFYCMVSDVFIYELIRGLYNDNKRRVFAGWAGYRATNGALVNFISTRCSFSQPLTKHDQSIVRFNNSIQQNDNSGLIDYANIPQDVKAINTLSVIQGTTIENNKLVNSTSCKSSYVHSVIPFRDICNQKRMVVGRAVSQALPLYKKDTPWLSVENAADIQGNNAVVYRNSEIPSDSFVVSKTFATNMLSANEVTNYYMVPIHCTINPVKLNTKFDRELHDMNLALGVVRNTIKKGDVLFNYLRVPFGGINSIPSKEQILRDLTTHEAQNSNSLIIPKERLDELEVKAESMYITEYIKSGLVAPKETVPVTASKAMSIISWSEEIIMSKGGEAKLVTVKSAVVKSLKVGSKMIDRYGNKGTVCEIRPTDEMPVIKKNGIEINVDVMYNPTVYKRKIGLAYKLEENLSLDASFEGEQFILPENITSEQAIDISKDIDRKVELIWNGEVTTTYKAGMHYLYHLDHDPADKLTTNKGSRVTVTDREYLKKMGFTLGFNKTVMNNIAAMIDKRVEINDGIPKVIDLKPSHKVYAKRAEAKLIIRKLNRDIIYSDFSSISRVSVESTIADVELQTRWGVIELIDGISPIYIAPGMMKPMADRTNSLILTNEMINLNAIVAENVSILYRRSKGWDANKQIARLQKLINTHKLLTAKSLTREMRDAYYKRVDAVRGVAVCNTELTINQIGIPVNVLKKFNKKYGKTNYILIRRHPIHRIYNSMIVQVVPVKGYAIHANPKLLAMMDGDSDGDLLEGAFLPSASSPLDLFRKYSPEALAKGHTDIKLKKFTVRERNSSQLSWDQHDLKFYTAISGAVALELFDRSASTGYGHTQVAELYHFLAQTALNIKHRRSGIETIQSISKLLKEENLKKYTRTGVIKLLLSANPNFRRTDIRRLYALLYQEPHKDLAYIRKSPSAEVLNKLAGTNILKIEQELDVYASVKKEVTSNLAA